jgi:hypothetical protein
MPIDGDSDVIKVIDAAETDRNTAVALAGSSETGEQIHLERERQIDTLLRGLDL